MNQNDEQMRAKFEAWFLQEDGTTRCSFALIGDDYKYPGVQRQWNIWQAAWQARAALEQPGDGVGVHRRDEYHNDPERQWVEFWREIVCPDGVLNVEQVKKELSDFSMLLKYVPEVYMYATGGMVSYATTLPSVVCGLIDDHISDLCNEDEEEDDPAPQASADDARDAAEIWQASHPGYQVSNMGRVRKGSRILQPYMRNKYLGVSIWIDGKQSDQYVHRLVAMAFLEKDSPEQKFVNHRDSDKTNNCASNLEWATAAENSCHATRVAFKGTRAVMGRRLSDGKEFHFNSLQEAVEAGFIRANIQKCIAGIRKMHGGYEWFDPAIDQAIAAMQKGEGK